MVPVPRIEKLSVRNYRALKDLELKDMTPLSVFVGPNASGKSTIFDVFAFLSECFAGGLRKAWDKRGRFKELKTRGETGPIEIEVKYRELPNTPIITYHLEIDETGNGPIVKYEFLQWRRGTGKAGKPFRFLEFREGKGIVVTAEQPAQTDTRVEENLASPDLLAVNTLGQLEKNPRVAALRKFITGWYLSYITADEIRGNPEAGPQEKLSQNGDNLPNVIQYLKERHPSWLDEIISRLKQRVPRLEAIDTTIMEDSRLLLQIKDAPFDKPVLAKFASDGTLKMLAYLLVLHDPKPPYLIGIEEPENYLHHRLLPGLAEECRSAAVRTQLMVTTHSPFFLNGLRPDEVWGLYRDASGFTKAKKATEIPGVTEFIREGALLGFLWAEGHFKFGDPLTNGGAPTQVGLFR